MCTFERYIQFDIETDIEIMISKGIWKKEVPQIYNALLTRLNRQDAVKIGDKWEPRGATINISQERIGQIAGIDAQRRRSIVNDCIQKMVDAGILAKERGGPGSHGTMKYIFLSQVRANEAALARGRSAYHPGLGTDDVIGEYPEKSGKALEEPVQSSKSRSIKEESPEADQSDTNQAVRENQKGVRVENNSCTPQSVHNQEYYPETSRIPSHPPLAASPSIAPPMPTEGEQAEHKSQPAYPAAEPTPEPNPPPPAAAEKPKTSQKEKNTEHPDPIGPDFAFRESFRLADKFAGDEIEFEDDNQRQQRATRFRNLLIKEFHSAPAAARYPDPDLRLQACVQIVHLWIDIVKSRNRPAEYIGFISTEPGMRALTQARKQIFGSADDYQEIELDPTVQAMWREKHGDNWREKRQQEIAARAA